MRRSTRLALFLVAIAISAAGAAAILLSMQQKISHRLEKGWVIPPLEVYSQGLPIHLDRKFPRDQALEELKHHDLRVDRDYQWLDGEACRSRFNELSVTDVAAECFWVGTPTPTLVAWDERGFIVGVWTGNPMGPVGYANLFPRLLTPFYDGQPILQINTPLSETPLECLQATTAIEDHDFLQHGGVSATGTLRALFRNLRAGRWAEGGSTITQQLVKNFFLTSKKTLRRKIEEQLLAILLESQLTKDQVLEMYLNVIYMGQSGPYQIRGFGAAAQAYFDKPLTKLSLSECALLGAIINSPGRYSPWQNPSAALGRRHLVLSRMSEYQMIDSRELAIADASPLPKPRDHRGAYAPYFALAAIQEFQSLEIEAEGGARLYTSLDPRSQNFLQESVEKTLPTIENKIKKPGPTPLQVAGLIVHVDSGQVLALIGGRDFKSTQYNRAITAERQWGSIVKPFVYWTALNAGKSPLSPIEDSSFEWKLDRTKWRPRNYDGKFHGTIPYFYALTQSLNIPAAKVGQEVGLNSIADTLYAAGVKKTISQLPALTLGAYETSPWTVAEAYLTLARLGSRAPLHSLMRVEDLQGHQLFERRGNAEQELDSNVTAELVGMLKNGFSIGTAQGYPEFFGTFAGKTGTTSDTKDTWFVGFNRHLLGVIWVGYDDNAPTGLAGSSAALPFWAQSMRKARELYREEDFSWPEDVEVKLISRDQLREDFPDLPQTGLPDSLPLIFRK